MLLFCTTQIFLLVFNWLNLVIRLSEITRTLFNFFVINSESYFAQTFFIIKRNFMSIHNLKLCTCND